MENAHTGVNALRDGDLGSAHAGAGIDHLRLGTLGKDRGQRDPERN